MITTGNPIYRVPPITKLMYDKHLKKLKEKNDPEINQFLSSLDQMNLILDAKTKELIENIESFEETYSTEYYKEKGSL